MAYNAEQTLEMVKMRLNKIGAPALLDSYLTARIEEAAQELEKGGIHLADNARDTLLVVDLAVWNYQSRDKTGERPRWLERKILRRWMHDDP